MPVTGLYMARRVHYCAMPYIRAYGLCVLRDIMPVFANLSERASSVASAEFKRLAERPMTEEFDDDMSRAAEAAQERGQALYDTMDAIRQTSLNLYAAGLFHLLEQQLADLCRDGAFDGLPPSDTKLHVLTHWYEGNFRLDLTELQAWPKINQLRLLANTVKHGEGKSAADLRAERPDLFQDPNLRDLWPAAPEMFTSSSVRRPMAGEDVFVTTEVFADFSEAANAFVMDVAQHFLAHKDEHYPVNG